MSYTLKPGETIEVFFGDDGVVRVEGKGFKGKTCVDASRELEKMLGKPGTRKLKPSYRQENKRTLKR